MIFIFSFYEDLYKHINPELAADAGRESDSS